MPLGDYDAVDPELAQFDYCRLDVGRQTEIESARVGLPL